MLNNLQISIIIPIYNVEQYLPKCLDSIFCQDIPLSIYEVICVNDCSPDKSRDIILKYQQKYENLILIDHEKNSKQGAARNTGLAQAKGEYIWFVDSDDYIQNNCLGKLLSTALENKLDILHFNAQKFTHQDKIEGYKNYRSISVETDVIEGYRFHQEYNYNDVTKEPWAQLYKKDFLTENNLLFLEHTFYEDAIHTLNAALISKRFKYISDVCYFYRVNPSSVVTNVNRKGELLANRVKQLINIMQLIQGYNNLKSIKNYCISVLRKVEIFYFFTLSSSERKIFIENISSINFDNLKRRIPLHTYIFYNNIASFNLISPPINIIFKYIQKARSKNNNI